MFFYEKMRYKSKTTTKKCVHKPFHLRFWKNRLMYDIHREKWKFERLGHQNKFYLICACPNFNKTSIFLLKTYFNSFVQSNKKFPGDRRKLMNLKHLKPRFYPNSNLFKIYGRNTPINFKRLLTKNQIHFPFHNLKELKYFLTISTKKGMSPYLFYPLVLTSKFKNNYVPIQYFNFNLNSNITLLNALRLQFLTIIKIIKFNLKLNLFLKMDLSCRAPRIFVDLAGDPNPIHPVEGNNPKLTPVGDLVKEFDEKGKLLPLAQENPAEVHDSYIATSDDEEALKRRHWFKKLLKRFFG